MTRIQRSLVMYVLTALLTATALTAASDGITKRIRFAKGKSSATVRGAVVRGDRDTYIVGAKAEQMMSVSISSLENNAVFTVQGPDGEFLQDAGEEDDAKGVTVPLPFDGDYRIKVGGTRGNATYRLTLTIR